MKVGRNELCPCGSGLKYKKCCLRKTQEEMLAEAIFDAQKNIKKDGHIKQCLHPNKSECSDTIVRSHAIQRNGALSRIAENGELKTLDGSLFYTFQKDDDKGKKNATIFTGFCSYHDKVLFQDIEDVDFAGTQKQIFLFTYRTAAWHYHKKQEQLKREKLFNERIAVRGFLPSSDLMNAVTMGISDNEKKKNILDQALLSENYGAVRSAIWEIPYEIHFAVSMQYEPTFDLEGNKINDYESDEMLKSIFLNIFPSEGKSYCIWSWLDEDSQVMGSFVEQFMGLQEKDRINFLNNKLPIWTESLVLSPALWNKWGEEIQQALITHANFDKLYFAHELEEGGEPFKYAYTPWDLFEENISS